MANRTSAEWRQYIYDKATKVSDKYKKRFPSFAEFNTALDDPETGGDLVQKVLTGMTKISDNFYSKFPDYNSLASTLAVNSKYTGKQRHDMRETAKDGIKSLYKGDFEKLWNNRDRLADKLNNLKLALAEGGNVNTQDAMKLQKGITNLQKGIELVNAYKGVESARSDDEFDTLIDGYIPAPQVAEYGEGVEIQVPSENKFLKQVMPTAEYKALELQGRAPTTGEAFFPEYSRRDREGGTGVSKALGGAKDLLRMTGRAVRPLAEEIMGTRAPNTSYMEEFARPDKFKTPSQEMSDEILGIQGLGGTTAKLGAMKLGQKIPALARGFNKALPFMNPSESIIGRVGGNVVNPSLLNQGARNLLTEAPNIALDVGYEATRSDDEVSNPLLAGLGGGLGASIAPALGAGAKGVLNKLTGNSELRKEILAGSPTLLNQELQLAKRMMPDVDLTSSGGKNQLIGIKENLGDFENKETGEYFGGQIGKLGDERRAMSQSLDRDLANEYNGLMYGEDPLDGTWSNGGKEGDFVSTDGLYPLEGEFSYGHKTSNKQKLLGNNQKLIGSNQKLIDGGASGGQKLLGERTKGGVPSIREDETLYSSVGGDGGTSNGFSGSKQTNWKGEYDKADEWVEPPVGSEELRAMDGVVYDKYLEQVKEAHPDVQNKVAKELFKANKIKVPSQGTLMEQAYDLQNLNNMQHPNDGFISDRILNNLRDKMSNVDGIGEKYEVLKKFKAKYGKKVNPNVLTKPPSVEKAFDSRTKLRQFATDEKEIGINKPLFQKAESIQKKVMTDYLTKSPKGRAIKAKHDKMAELYGLKDRLPDLTDGRLVDNFFEKIGRSRMNISTKANTFNDMLKLQDAINKETGMNTDFVTNAVLRRIQNKSFWNDYLGDGNAGLVNKALVMAKDLSGQALTGGKLPALLAQIARKAKAKDPTKERQKSAKRNTTGEKQIGDANKVFTDLRMKSILEGIERRKESDRLKLNLQGNR